MAVARTTTWIFPSHYGDLLEPQVWHAAWVVLAARNLVYLAIVAWLGGRLLTMRATGGLPNPAPLLHGPHRNRNKRHVTSLSPPAASGG